MLEAFVAGAGAIFTVATLVSMVLGVIAGIIAAAIPGFTITMAIILTLPLTFAMPPLQGVATMLAVYVGGYTGGLFSAALLGISGERRPRWRRPSTPFRWPAAESRGGRWGSASGHRSSARSSAPSCWSWRHRRWR